MEVEIPLEQGVAVVTANDGRQVVVYVASERGGLGVVLRYLWFVAVLGTAYAILRAADGRLSGLVAVGAVCGLVGLTLVLGFFQARKELRVSPEGWTLVTRLRLLTFLPSIRWGTVKGALQSFVELRATVTYDGANLDLVTDNMTIPLMRGANRERAEAASARVGRVLQALRDE